MSQMLTKGQERKIRQSHTKKGREKSGLCLVEGQKIIDVAGDAVELRFTPADTNHFTQLVTTETPQDAAALARIPQWSMEDVLARDLVVVLDGVQDPGNVGAILRLCQGFDASLLLVESVDVASPKVVRSSVGALFHVPWMRVARPEAIETITGIERPIYRLEKRDGADGVRSLEAKQMVLIAGSEGNGIQLDIDGASLFIEHEEALESLNVGHALAIAMYTIHGLK